MPTLRSTILKLGCALIAATSFPLFAQNFDTSGNAALSGNYLFRYVVYGATSGTGTLTEGCSVTGTINFDGKGNYTVPSAQVYDSVTNNGNCSQPTGKKTYAVQPNGIAQLDSLLFTNVTIYGSFSQPVLTGSSTEDGYYDMFVAVQAPSSPTSNAALKGAYQVGSLEFTAAQNNLARQGWFTLNADGTGAVSPLTVTGSAVNLGTASLTQKVIGATYSFSGNGIGTLTIPGSGNGQLVSGAKVLYLSADGNYILGGSTTGFDMVFGFKAAAAGASNSLFSGTYFTSGLEGDLSRVSSNYSFLDAFYGAINANGAGTGVWHQRFDDIVDVSTFDYTFTEGVDFASSGVSTGATYTTLIGVNGQAAMVIGSGTTFAMDIGVKAPAYNPGSGISLNPVGITNAANFTPLTNSFTPGELVNLYGTFGVAAQIAKLIPIPTTLGGVQVLVNSKPAPVYAVGPSTLSVLIPYAVANDNFATFQVVINGAKSNTNTVYLNKSAPGIYTLGQNGVGASAILHADFTIVSAASPAKPGETVLLFMNGLGIVTPPVSDGAAGPVNPLSLVNAHVGISLNDGVNASASATIAFSGLAPGFPGLYQVNFVVPSTGLRSGTSLINFQTDAAITAMSSINLGGFPTASAIPATAAIRSHPLVAAPVARPSQTRLTRRHAAA